MPYKLNTDGTLATTGEGDKKMPIFIHPDGREAALDGDATIASISRLNGEARANRLAKEELEAKFAPFAGIEDAEAAKKALDTVKNLGAGELKTAAQVQEIKDAAARSAQEAVANATRAAEGRERELTEKATKLTGQLNTLIVGTAFTGSKFVAEKLAIPSDIAQKFFGDRFKVDDGKLVPLDRTGNPLFSAVRHGEHADVDEALQVMVGEYAHKDAILKGSGASGGGATGGNGKAPGQDLSHLPPVERMNAARAQAK